MKYLVGTRIVHHSEPTEHDLKAGREPISFGPGVVIHSQKRSRGFADLVTIRFDSGYSGRFSDDSEKLSVEP